MDVDKNKMDNHLPYKLELQNMPTIKKHALTEGEARSIPHLLWVSPPPRSSHSFALFSGLVYNEALSFIQLVWFPRSVYLVWELPSPLIVLATFTFMYFCGFPTYAINIPNYECSLQFWLEFWLFQFSWYLTKRFFLISICAYITIDLLYDQKDTLGIKYRRDKRRLLWAQSISTWPARVKSWIPTKFE